MTDPEPVTIIACVKERVETTPSCGGRGASATLDALRAELTRRGLTAPVVEVQCLGRCTIGPNLRLKGGVFFTGMTVERVGEVCDAVVAQQDGGEKQRGDIA